MRQLVVILSTAVVTAILTSAFWIVSYNNLLKNQASEVGGRLASAPTSESAAVQKRKKEAAQSAHGGSNKLAVPVANIKPEELRDTFTEARAGGARVHDAIDIMSPAGTHVVSAAPGTVEKLFFSKGGGGITIYIRSKNRRWMYYYAHLNSYASGLKEDMAVARGQVIGTVGSTGNASARGPHLHFAVHRMNEGESWWRGSAVNPYPLLTSQ